MARPQTTLTEFDPVWNRICEEAEAAIAQEPLMGGLIHAGVLHHNSFDKSVIDLAVIRLLYRLFFFLLFIVGWICRSFVWL